MYFRRERRDWTQMGSMPRDPRCGAIGRAFSQSATLRQARLRRCSSRSRVATRRIYRLPLPISGRMAAADATESSRKNSRNRATLVVLLSLIVAVSPDASAADPDAVARGAYLAGAAGCDRCHTD